MGRKKERKNTFLSSKYFYFQENKKLQELKMMSLTTAIKREKIDNDKEEAISDSKLCQGEFEGLPNVEKSALDGARNLLNLESVESSSSSLSLTQGSVSENTSGIEAIEDDSTLFVSEDFVEDLEDIEQPNNATGSDSKLGILEGLFEESFLFFSDSYVN